MVDGTPQIHVLARDPDDHFVEMPAIARSRTAPSHASSDRRSEFEHPTANALVGEVKAALEKQLFDIAIRQPVPEIPPDREDNDLRREPKPDERSQRRYALTPDMVTDHRTRVTDN